MSRLGMTLTAPRRPYGPLGSATDPMQALYERMGMRMGTAGTSAPPTAPTAPTSATPPPAPVQGQTVAPPATPAPGQPVTPPATPWWADPTQAAKILQTLGDAYPKPASTDPAALQAIQLKQTQDLIAQLNTDAANQRSATQGNLGGLNMTNSGLGMATLAQQDNDLYARQAAAANNLAAIQAQENLAYNQQSNEFNLNRANQIGQYALGIGGLAQRGQEINHQNEQFYADQQFRATQADLDRAQQLGVLAAQQSFAGGQSAAQRQHETEMAQLAAVNQRAAQELDHAFQMGLLGAQQQFQGSQATQQQSHELDMQHAQLSQQLQITLAQLADAAAGRTQQSQQAMAQLSLQAQQIQAAIEQNRAQNTLQAQQQQNQFSLGMGGLQIQGGQLGLQQQQLGLQAQNQQVGNQISALGLIQHGLNPESQYAQSLMSNVGMGPPPGSAQSTSRPMPVMSFDQYATQHGLPSYLVQGAPRVAGSSADIAYRDMHNAYDQYAMQHQPQQTFGMGTPTWSDVANLGQLNNQTAQIQNQQNQQQFLDQLMMSRMGSGSTQPNAGNGTVLTNPLDAYSINNIASSIKNGIVPNYERGELTRLMPLALQSGKVTQSQSDWVKKQLGLLN